MADIKVTLNASPSNVVKVYPNVASLSSAKLSTLSDVDISGILQDSMLMYDIPSETWIAKNIQNNQTVDGGIY